MGISERQTFLYVLASRFAHPPDRSHRCPRLRQGRRGFYVRAAPASLPPHASDMLAVRIQVIDGERTFTRPDSQPYRLLRTPLPCPPCPREQGFRTGRVCRLSKAAFLTQLSLTDQEADYFWMTAPPDRTLRIGAVAITSSLATILRNRLAILISIASPS